MQRKAKELLKTIVLKTVTDVVMLAITIGIIFGSVMSIQAEEEPIPTIVKEPIIVIRDTSDPVMVEVTTEAEPEQTTEPVVDIDVEKEILQVRMDNAIEAYYWAYVDPETGERTDITPEEMLLVEDILKDKPAAIVMAIAMVETRGDEDAFGGGNGLCQITGSTGKEIWTKMMGLDETSYSKDILYDGEANIIMASVYVNYLWDKHNSIEGVLDAYHGDANDNYKSKIAKWLSYSGLTFEDVNEEYF